MPINLAHSPVLVSHSLTVPSSPPVARMDLSLPGKTSMDSTAPPCPFQASTVTVEEPSLASDDAGPSFIPVMK